MPSVIGQLTKGGAFDKIVDAKDVAGNITGSAISASGTVTMLTASIGGGIFTSASLAAGGGDGSGTVTQIVSGDGLNGGTITSTGTISVDSASMGGFYSGSMNSFTTAGAISTSGDLYFENQGGLWFNSQSANPEIRIKLMSEGGNLYINSGSAVAHNLHQSNTGHVSLGTIGDSGKTLTISGSISASGDLFLEGSVHAQQYIVSSSVTTMSIAYASGSTQFGDTSDDTHTFIGDIITSGSLIISGASALGDAALTLVPASPLAYGLLITGSTYNGVPLGLIQGGSGEMIYGKTTGSVNVDVFRIRQGVGGGGSLELFNSASDGGQEVGHSFLDPHRSENSYVCFSNHSQSDAYFGIGTDSPDSHLHVSGNAKIAGDIYLDGYLYDNDAQQRVQLGETTRFVGNISSSGATFTDKLVISASNSASNSTGLTVDGDISASGDLFVGDVGGSFVSWSKGGTFEINQDSATSNEKLFVISEDDSEKFSVDEDGDITATGKITTTGTNAYFLAQESANEWIMMRVGTAATANSQMIAWDDEDDLHLGVLTGPDDETLDTKMMISASGNVGIGTTTPSKTLTVAGDISASGDLIGSSFYTNDASGSVNFYRPVNDILLQQEVWGNTFQPLSGSYGLSVNDWKEKVAETEFSDASTGNISTTPLLNGNVLVAYEAAGSGSFAIYGSGGNEIKSETEFAITNVAHISATTLTNGNVLIAYIDDGDGDIGKFVIVDSAGNLVKSITAFCGLTVSGNGILATTTLTNGNAFIAHQQFVYDGGAIYTLEYTIIDPAGNLVKSGVLRTGTLESISVTTLSNGNILIVYTNGDGYFQILDPTGNVVKGETVINTETARYASTTTLSNGNTLIAYLSQTPSDGESYFIIIDPAGNIVKSETEFHNDYCYGINAVALPSGHVLISWYEFHDDGYGRYVVYDNNGNLIKSETTFRAFETTYLSSTALTNGNVFLVYTDNDDSGKGKFIILESTGPKFNKTLTVEGDISASGDLYLSEWAPAIHLNYGKSSYHNILLQASAMGEEVGLTFRSGSTRLMQISSSKGSPFVGIGTQTPPRTLTVEGSISASGNLYLSTVQDQIKFERTGEPSYILQSKYAENKALAFYDVNAGSYRFMVASGSGKFLIGTVNTSSAKLTVKGDISASGDLYLNTDDGNVFLGGAGGNSAALTLTDLSNNYSASLKQHTLLTSLKLNQASSQDFSIDTHETDNNFYIEGGGGNVGIKTNVPTKTLTVEGDISASGDFILGGLGAEPHLSASSGNLTLSGSGDGYLEVAGDISASGVVYASAFSTSTGSNINVNDITASGNISSSGTITMLTASIGGGTFTSASLAAGGGGGGVSFPYDGDISASGDFMIHTPLALHRGIHWNSGSGYLDVSLRSAAGSIYVGSGSVNRHILHSIGTGNVGINTLNPPKTLTVLGDIYQSGSSNAIYAEGDISASGDLYLGNSEPRVKLTETDTTVLDRSGTPQAVNPSWSTILSAGTFIIANAVSAEFPFKIKHEVPTNTLVLSGSNYTTPYVGIGTVTPQKTLTVQGDISASGDYYKGTEIAPVVHVDMRNDDYYIAATTTQNTWYGTGYPGISLGTSIGSENILNLMKANAYVAPSNMTLSKLSFAMYAVDASPATTFGLEFKVLKFTIADGSTAAVTPTEISPDSSIDFTATENTSYIKHMTFSSGNTLSKGDALIIVVRNTTAATLKMQVNGNITAELYKT